MLLHLSAHIRYIPFYHAPFWLSCICKTHCTVNWTRFLRNNNCCDIQSRNNDIFVSRLKPVLALQSLINFLYIIFSLSLSLSLSLSTFPSLYILKRYLERSPKNRFLLVTIIKVTISIARRERVIKSAVDEGNIMGCLRSTYRGLEWVLCQNTSRLARERSLFFSET